MNELENLSVEEKLQKLMELRGKDELTQDEETQLEWLENRMSTAFTVSSEEDTDSEESVAAQVVERLIESGVIPTKEEREKEKERIERALNPEFKDLEVGEELTPKWMKRTAKVINAGIAKSKEDTGKYERLKGEVVQEIKDMGSRERAYENKIVKQKAKEAMDRAGSSIQCSVGAEAKIKRMAKQAMYRTLEIATSAGGGTLLPKPFLAELAVVIEERGSARNLFRGLPMGSDSIDLDKIATKPEAFWTGENVLMDPSDAAFGEGVLSANKLTGLSSWSMELQEDSAYAFIPVIADLFAESILDKEDKAGFIGDGTADHGGFTGILNLSGAQVVTMAGGNTTINSADLDFYRSLRDQLTLARRNGAMYFLHPDHESNLEGQKSDDGEYIYRRPADQSRPGSLWGYPVVLVEVLPTSGGASTKFTAFGNPLYYLFGTRRALSAQTSTDGVISDGSGNVSYNAFQQDGVLWRTTERIGLAAQLEDVFAVGQTAAA